MSRLIYSLLFYLLVPFVLVRLLYRSIREPGYRTSLSERFGFYRSPHKGEFVWVHAVSAGETIAAVPLVERLVAEGYPCLVSNMTPTGRERVRAMLKDGVENCYAPYDLPGAVARFLDNNRPRLFITIDTELWPNILAGCRARGIPALLVNGRLSQKSASGYSVLGPLTRPMLDALDRISVQTEAHARRFNALGVAQEKIVVTGSIKFDGEVRSGFDDRYRHAGTLTDGRPVLLGASTHEGEEQAMISAWQAAKQVRSNMLLVLAPRHPHRTGQVARLCESRGLSPVMFTSGEKPVSADAVLIIDTMGELDAFFPLSQVTFVGGSLAPVGGHNLLEAVRAESAVVMGPHLRNIEDIAQQFVDAGAMQIVNDEHELGQVVSGLMKDDQSRRQMVEAANQVYDRNRGALDRVVRMALDLLNHE